MSLMTVGGPGRPLAPVPHAAMLPAGSLGANLQAIDPARSDEAHGHRRTPSTIPNYVPDVGEGRGRYAIGARESITNADPEILGITAADVFPDVK